MKKSLALFLFISLNCFGQPAANNEVKKMCLNLEIHNTETDARFLVKVKNCRKIICNETSGKERIARKVIKIDKNSFALFKNAIVNEGNLYSLPDTINCKTCKQNSLLTLMVKTEKGDISLAGINPQEVNKDIKYIIDQLMRMVGTTRTGITKIK